MGYPSYPVQQPAKPPISGGDMAVSIVTLVATVLMGGAAAVMGVFVLAFLDYCPPESCSAEGAATAVFGSLVVAAAIGLLGLIATVVALVRRRKAWPFALGTLALCAIALGGGVVGYAVAVGA